MHCTFFQPIRNPLLVTSSANISWSWFQLSGFSSTGQEVGPGSSKPSNRTWVTLESWVLFSQLSQHTAEMQFCHQHRYCHKTENRHFLGVRFPKRRSLRWVELDVINILLNLFMAFKVAARILLLHAPLQAYWILLFYDTGEVQLNCLRLENAFSLHAVDDVLGKQIEWQ